MTTRLLILPAMLAALFAVSGSPVHGDLPTAPPPRPKAPPAGKPKMAAELLVGTWKLVKHNNPGLPVGYELTIEYAKDGKLTIRSNNPLEGLRVGTGTYRLEGKTLRRTLDSGAALHVQIDSITEDEIVTSSQIGSDLHISEFKRVRDR